MFKLRLHSAILCPVVVLVATSFASNVSASITYSASADPNASPDASVSTGGNINFWTVSTTNGNSGQNGSFFSSPNWGLYANSGQQATATSVNFSSLSGISRALNSNGDSVEITLDHGSIQNGGSIGVYVRNNANTVVSTVFFNGGDTTYRVTDGTGSNSSLGVGFTSSSFKMKFALNNTSGGYTLSVNGNNFVRALGGTTINSIAVFNNNAGFGGGADFLYSPVKITAVPEPTSLLTMSALAGVFGYRKWRSRKLKSKV